MNNPIRVAACGVLEIEGEDREGIFLEGSRDAIREGARFCGEDVCIVRADLADLACARLEAAEAMAEALTQADEAITREINPSNYSHDDVCRLNDEAMEAVSIVQAALAAWHATQKGGDA